MRFLTTSLAIAVALLAITACTGKSSDSSSNSSTSTSASDSGMAASPAASTAAGSIPSYPGATTQASGSSSGAMGSAAGTVMTTDDSFDKVYAWYQQNMPAGAEKSHTTSPIQSAVFTVGDPSSGQTSVTITTQGGKTMITVGKVKS